MNTIARALPRRPLLVQAAPLAIGLWLAWWMIGRTGQHGLAGVFAGLGAIAPWQWGMALSFTAVSYVAIGRYDRAVHGWIGTGIAPQAAEHSGRVAIALSQLAGMGLVTGTLARWYLLPDLGLARAAAVTASVGASFLCGFAVVGAAAGLLTGVLPPMLVPMASAILWTAGAVILASVILPARRGLRWLPAVPRVAMVLALVALDVLGAGIAFAALLGTFDPVAVAAAVLALGAGLVAATPAGIGGFDATLAALLPVRDLEPLMTAALAFHIVYFGGPGLLAAAVLLVRPGLARATNAAPRGARIVPGSDVLDQLERAPRAESWLCAQTGALALTGGRGGFLCGLHRGRSTLIALFPPESGLPLTPLSLLAEGEGRGALAYKLTGAGAAGARRRGWCVRRCGVEAWVRPGSFETDGPAHRQLRRKLRHARRAGVSVARLAGPLPWPALVEIDAAWRTTRGRPRGASMGRLCPQATARQIVYLASVGGGPVAFISLHATPSERTLDLMRAYPGLPDGTMHALVAAAIGDAARDGVPRLSLAAVPEQPLPARLSRAFDRLSGAAGLRQFKASFAPHWSPLYAAAPTASALALGLADLAREIVSDSDASAA